MDKDGIGTIVRMQLEYREGRQVKIAASNYR